ncbi:MAG: hypothetical protein ACJ741_11620 [Pyrinomonadaceae bacterium]
MFRLLPRLDDLGLQLRTLFARRVALAFDALKFKGALVEFLFDLSAPFWNRIQVSL